MPKHPVTAHAIWRRRISRARCNGCRSAWRTDPGHIEAVGGGSHFDDDRNLRYETRPRGTAVSHEEEMLKLAGNQAGYDAVTSIYTHGLSLIKTAIGKV
jgi:flagellar basal-body rod protein FlgB